VFWNTIGTKKGKPASVHLPGVHALRTAAGLEITLNVESRPIYNKDGIRVDPGDARRGVLAEGTEVDDHGVVTTAFSSEIRFNKRFFRGLHKIAFNLICHHKGASYLLDSRFDPVREYVRWGRGSRYLVLSKQSRGPQNYTPLHFHLESVPSRGAWFVNLEMVTQFWVEIGPSPQILATADERALEEAGLILRSDNSSRATAR
jgi:hypothetical protein